VQLAKHTHKKTEPWLGCGILTLFTLGVVGKISAITHNTQLAYCSERILRSPLQLFSTFSAFKVLKEVAIWINHQQIVSTRKRLLI
jgi:hypothetical protein